MSAQEKVPNWRAAAYAALSEFYKIESERASFEQRMEDAKKACIAAGVSFRYGTPQVEHTDEAVRCPCGAVVVNDYYARQRPKSVDGIVYCDACNEKTAELAAADAKLEGRDLEAEQKKSAPAKTPPAAPAEEMPF